jgi:hypothetical protein
MLAWGGSGVAESEFPRHAEMDHEPVTVLEASSEILPAPFECDDVVPAHAAGEDWPRIEQNILGVLAAERADDQRAEENGRQGAADGFDFR